MASGLPKVKKKHRETISLFVSPQEFDAILASLRFWQHEREDKGEIPMREIAEDHGKAISLTALDRLCYRLNTGGR